MRVAVTGASGVVGRFVVADLHARGVAVRAWARPSTDRGGFTGPIEWMEGGLAVPGAAAALVDGVDAVVHCALAHVPGRYRGGEGPDLDAWLQANVHGSLQLMTAARRAGAARFVFLSSRAVYGDARPEAELDEENVCLPDSHYGAAKRAIEAFVQSFGLGHGWGTTALRATGVYGLTHPLARTKWYELTSAMLARTPWPGRGGGTEVHGADLARAVWTLLTCDDVRGQLYNCSDLYVTDREIGALVQRHGQIATPLPAAPAAPPRRVMRSTRLEALGVRFGGRPLLEATIASLVEQVRAASAR